MTLQSSFGCLRTAANFLQTNERTYSRRLSYGDGQTFANMLMSTLVGRLNTFTFFGSARSRELWPSTSIKACQQTPNACHSRQDGRCTQDGAARVFLFLRSAMHLLHACSACDKRERTFTRDPISFLAKPSA